MLNAVVLLFPNHPNIMRLNLTNVANAIAIENASAELLNAYYAEIANDPTGFRELYAIDCWYIEQSNSQTWDMIHFYESRYGLDWVNKNVNAHIDEIPTYTNWLENFLNNVNCLVY